MEVVLDQVATGSDAASADSAASPTQQAAPAAVDVQNIREDAPADSLSLIYQPGETKPPHDISAKLNADAAFKALIRKHLEKYGIDSDAVAEEAFESAKEVVEAHIRRQHADRASKEFDFSGLLNTLATQDPASLITLHLKLSDPSAGNFMAQPGDETVRVSYDGTQGVITVQGQVDAVQKFVNQIYFHADVNHLKHFWIDVKLVTAPIEKTTPPLALVSDAAAATVARAETIVEITPLSARVFMFYEKSTGFYVAQQPIKSAGAAQIGNETIAILTPRGDTIQIAARELPTLQRNFIEGGAEGARGALTIEETILIKSGAVPFVNSAPIANDDAFAALSGVGLLIQSNGGGSGLLDNDTDVDAHPLSIIAFDAASANGGTIVDNLNGSYSFTSAPGFIGSDSFSYTISDGNGGSDTAMVNITVNAGPNDLTPSVMDNLVGGGGADAFIGLASNWHPTDTVDGGAGADTLTITSGALNITIDAANYTGFEEIETLILPDAAHNITIDNDYFTRGAGPSGNQFAIDANVATNDITINASAVAAPNALNITTGTGNDTITTGAGNDSIVSGDGNDVIDAGLGQNSIDAGAGNDQVTTSWSVETAPDIVNSANLVMWLDAADLDGDGLQEGTAEATRAGGNVVSWVDKAALGGVNSVTNLAGSGTIVTGGVASLDTVQYIGGAIGVATSPFGATNAESTIFFVTQENARGNNILFNFNGTSSTDRYLFHAPWSDGAWYYDPGQWDGVPNNRTQIGGNQTAIGDVTLVTGIKSVAAGQNTLSLNGGASTDNSGNSTLTDTSQGLRITSAAPSNHEIAELIVFNTVLTPAEIEQVESYLAYKWETDGLLAGGHGFAATTPASDDTIEGGAGDDTLIINANKIVSNFDGSNNISGFETINLSGNDNAHNLTFTDGYFTAGTGVNGNRLTVSLAGNALGATIVASTVSVAYAFTLTGGNGADNVSTGAGADIIIGNAGNDTMNGGAGDDTITGGHDNDSITGGLGTDRFIIVDDPDDAANGGTTEITDFVVNAERIDLSAFGANEFANLAFTNIGPDVQIDLAGIGGVGQLLLLRNVLAAQLDVNDFIGLTQNVLTANSNDILTTTAGADAFSGTAANWHSTDSVDGGAGNDTLTITSGAVNITINAANYTGFEEVETLVLPDAAHSITLDNDYFTRGAGLIGNQFIIAAGVATNDIIINGSAIAAPNGLNITTGTGNDNLTTGAGNDSIVSGDGNDTISSGAGADTINGGAGNDSITAGSGDDSISGDLGNDTILAAAGNDTITGGIGDDSITAGSGDDVVQGNDGNDTIMGGSGLNQLDGGAGEDIIFAGADSDTIDGGTDDDVLHGGDSGDSLSGSGGNDIIYGDDGVFQQTAGLIVFEAEHYASKLDSANHSWEITDYAPASGGQVVHIADGVANGGNNGERVSYNVEFTSTGTFYLWVRGTAVLRTAGNTGNADSLFIEVDGVNVTTGPNNGAGGPLTGYNDALNWNSALTRAQFNIATAGEHTITLLAREDGFAADKILITNNAGFTPAGVGPAENARVVTSGGNDTIDGGAGNDTIYGDLGSDTITGGLGADTMSGGADADSFVFHAINESPTGTPDLITDFQTGVDVIDLSALGIAFNVASASGTAGNGVADFTGGPGGAEISWGQGGGNTTIFIDSNGDDVADMEIILTGLINLAHADFVF